MTDLLQNHDIAYVKWDMNRNLSDVYSRALPPERQGEAAHRYMLGVYRLLETLTQRFPQVLFEGCAGGGGRFDAGMLCYFPQIWCSDDTDAVERLTISTAPASGTRSRPWGRTFRPAPTTRPAAPRRWAPAPWWLCAAPLGMSWTLAA